MTNTLTDEEADRLTTLTGEVASLKKELVDVSRTRAEVRIFHAFSATLN